MQMDSVKDSILHLDFVQVTRGLTLETKVPLELVGESSGVKNMGGILEFHQSEILIRCRPSQLPKGLTLDISQLELGESLQLKDLPVLEGVEYLGEPDSNVVTCVGSASGRAGAEESDQSDSSEEESEAPESSDDAESNVENE